MTTIDANAFRPIGLPERVFALGLDTRPASVRDSIWRAEWFAGELDRIVRKADKRAIVAGLGPSGMALALALLRLGWTITTCNMPFGKNDEPIGASLYRTLCPTTFDFPFPHWSTRSFPLPGMRSVMAWEHGIAHQVMNKLVSQFNIACENYELGGKFRHFDRSWISSISMSPKEELEIKISSDLRDGVIPRKVDACIFCIGVGRHANCMISTSPGFKSHGFWTNADPLLAGRNAGEKKRVCIIGGQDGGLGDFVRLATGRRDPFELILALKIPYAIVDKLVDSEHQLWDDFEAELSHSCHDYQVVAHNKTLELACLAWDDRDIRSRVVNEILLEKRSRPILQLAFPCCHFGFSYAANRFAAMMVAMALSQPESQEGVSPLLPWAKCVAINGHGNHACRGDSVECSMHSHTVKFDRADCNLQVSNGIGTENEADVKGFTHMSCHQTHEFPLLADRVLLRLGSRTTDQYLPTEVANAISSPDRRVLRHRPPFLKK